MYHCTQEQPLVFDIASATTKTHNPKKDQERSISDLLEGTNYKMFAQQPTGSKVAITQNGDFLCNITLNMEHFHYSVSHIDRSTSGPSGDDDEDDEKKK